MVKLPSGFRLERLRRDHPRGRFQSGDEPVDAWLATKSFSHQEKHLSVTKVLLDEANEIAGYYTLATSQVDFADLPPDVTKRLPRRALPVAVLAWLGVFRDRHRQGIGSLLMAHALGDCYKAGETFAFVAVILDCINVSAKSFYQRWDFFELPGRPSRLYLSASQLKAMIEAT
jgi:GNAT superfamily N-acetyltransferase